MTRNMSDLVDEPELIDAPDDVSISRWTEYGHDRLYINGSRVEPYIDLEDGSLGDTGCVRVNAEFDGDTVTIEIGDEGTHSRHDFIVISLSGDVDEDDGNDGVTSEVPDAVPHNSETARTAQQINAQQLGEGSEDTTTEIETVDSEEAADAEEIDVVSAGGMETPDVGTEGRCLHSGCNDPADVAVRVNTGQVRHYCEYHRRSADNRGHMIVKEDAQIRTATDDNGNDGRLIADGGREEWLLYGHPADVIDEPDYVFARHDREFVLMPLSLFEHEAVEDAEHVPGEIFMDTISTDDDYHGIVEQLEPIDPDELVADLVADTVYSEREAQMVVFGGWFGMARLDIADALNLSKHTVRNHIEAAKSRYKKAKNTADTYQGL